MRATDESVVIPAQEYYAKRVRYYLGRMVGGQANRLLIFGYLSLGFFIAKPKKDADVDVPLADVLRVDVNTPAV